MLFKNYFFVPLMVLGLVSALFFGHVAQANTPLPQTDVPDSVTEDGITLTKEASNDVVPLGEIFSYTVTIANQTDSIIEPTISDTLPEALALRTDHIEAPTGTLEITNVSFQWTGEIAPNETVEISYEAVPPSVSNTSEGIVNVVELSWKDTTLQAGTSIDTIVGDYGILWSFLSPIVNFIAIALLQLNAVLAGISLPYSFGFAIILFTVLIRAATFPLNLQQIKSAKAMQELQPQLKELQEKYGDDRESLAMAQMELYRQAGVNPLGGCLPMLVQMPVWISLYWALIQLSSENQLQEGFFWIPSLAGPVEYNEASINWLIGAFPPPIGLETAVAYLVLPVLLVVTQIYMQDLLTPPATDPQQAQMQSIMKVMPLMFGYFALIVPSGLTLYWFTSNILMMVQQYFTRTHINPPAPETVTKAIAAKTDKTDNKPKQGNKKANERPKSKRKSKRKRKNG